MSFETTLREAVEDFKAKFAGQHREAMKQEFETAQAMMLDAHKSLNEAEKVMGVNLTPMVVPVGLLEELDGSGVLAVPVEMMAERVDPTAKVRRASRAFDKMRKGGQESAKRAKRVQLARAVMEAKENGLSYREINRACKRSASWAHNFLRDTREMGLI